MNPQFGRTLRALRLQRELTQEELADMLNVSCQSISRWEHDVCCPDLSLLPALAGIFGVTTDTLLSCDPEGARAAADALRREAWHMAARDPEQAERLLRQGIAQYPGDEDLLTDLLWYLRAPDRAGERVELCRRLRRSKRPEVRFEATRVLAKTCLSRGDRELARSLLLELPDMERTALEVRAELLEGEEGLQAAQREKTASLARLLHMMRIVAAQDAAAGRYADARNAIETARNVLDAFREDPPYRFPAGERAVRIWEAFQPEREELERLKRQYAGAESG